MLHTWTMRLLLGLFSKFYLLSYGVPWEFNLGPILFLFFVNLIKIFSDIFAYIAVALALRQCHLVCK